MKIDLKKSEGDFLFVNTFPPKLKCLLLDLSVLYGTNLISYNLFCDVIFSLWESYDTNSIHIIKNIVANQLVVCIVLHASNPMVEYLFLLF